MYIAGVFFSCLPVSVLAVVQHWYVEMSPVVAVLVPWGIEMCMFTIVHCRTDIGMSDVGELFLHRR